MPTDYTTESVQEILARTRRIETRLTRYIADHNGETGARKPILSVDTVVAPGFFATVADLVDAVPMHQREPGKGFDVVINGKTLATIYPSEA